MQLLRAAVKHLPFVIAAIQSILNLADKFYPKANSLENGAKDTL